MTTAFPIDGYRADLSRITENVFETMLGVSVKQVEAGADGHREFCAAVYYAGTWQGALILECSKEQARDWAGRLMSLDAPAEQDDDARDVLGEISNVLAGNLKPLLPTGVGLSIPSVVDGSSYVLRICGGNLFESMEFSDPLESFRLTFVEVITSRS